MTWLDICYAVCWVLGHQLEKIDSGLFEDYVARDVYRCKRCWRAWMSKVEE